MSSADKVFGCHATHYPPPSRSRDDHCDSIGTGTRCSGAGTRAERYSFPSSSRKQRRGDMYVVGAAAQLPGKPPGEPGHRKAPQTQLV